MQDLNDTQQGLWRRQLEAGLEALGLDLPDQARERLLAYLALLLKWNQAYNLTAVREPRQMVSRQLLDSLAVLPWVCGPRVLDVGTGAGLPGIPLAIARPEWRFTLLDSNGKKIRFVQQAKTELGLSNIEVRQERIESLCDEEGFDSITSRAFSALVEFVRGSRPVLAPHGRWLAMKSAAIDAELADLMGLEERLTIEQFPLQVPGEPAARQLVLITRQVRSESG